MPDTHAPAGSASALPLLFNESTICAGGLCEDPQLPYQRVAGAGVNQPGYQWDDAGGYCGSWATQRATLAVGAWVSQQQVRDHTSPCGGNDNEIISCNIEEAYTNLKLDFEGWDYKNSPRPQQPAFFKWLKKHLAQGYAVAVMIMWSGQSYPIYNLTPPAGMYGHVEPWIGIQSNHPLTDETVYDDDVVLHFTDGGLNTVHRVISTLPGTWGGQIGDKAKCGEYSYCIGPWAFGWAVKGFDPKADAKHATAAQASLAIAPSKSEPDTRSGEKPNAIMGTLTATGLTKGGKYDVYRWDSVDEAFTYTAQYKKASFTADAETHVYKDDKSFQSDSTTYYRVVQA
eukprot:g592.t1